MKKIILLVITIILSNFLIADEGMWLPILLQKYKYEDIKSKGFKLTAEDIYSINKASMKDAIVLFGRGCTGEIVSDKGLLLTNHHCGYGSIQAQSSVEHDYLAEGFWAKQISEELPNPRLTVTFLVRMQDVTNEILSNVTNNITEEQRNIIINKNILILKKQYSENKKFSVDIKPFYYGNEYYMFIYQVYKDVRLVGAPPSAIGKFGGDTDNWMWPRHTGDFSVFRIYANKNNEPAEYSPENVPYKPVKYFPISIKGVNKDDFTMVYGFPGHTQEYIPSFAVKQITEIENPIQIKLREIRLGIMEKEMNQSQKVRIQYSNKYAGVANYWKKWLGENKGLQVADAINKKQLFEDKFQQWAQTNKSEKTDYTNLLNKYKIIYDYLAPYSKTEAYLQEGIFACEMIKFSSNFKNIDNIINSNDSTINAFINLVSGRAKDFYKDFYLTIDKNIMCIMLQTYYNNTEIKYQPIFFQELIKKHKGNLEQCVNDICKKSYFTSESKLNLLIGFVKNKKIKYIKNDNIYMLYSNFAKIYNDSIIAKTEYYNNVLDSLNRIYMKAQMEFKSDKIFYPDANLTLRVAYGKVSDYSPHDCVKYDWFTTLDGIIEKDDSTVFDYKVPTRLKELWQKKDYSRYAENGVMKVCFTASNHTTGGNSGSPVLNGNGELIGINFDRNWEGTMSDIYYNPDKCRNITLDIRYVLFIIDKFAGAKNLIDEMQINDK